MSDVESPPTTASTPGGVAVEVGSRVRLRDADGEHEHTIVARLTAGAPLTCVSVEAPVGRALLGRRQGEEVQVHTPDGVRLLTVVDVVPPRVAPPWSGSPQRGQ